ncbi:MAG: hypothetical protein Q4F11_08265 [Eubacteriales bacterium]|nr:hypothetical protein [Eubacteriales bacterium]
MGITGDFNEKYEEIRKRILDGIYSFTDIGPDDILYHYTKMNGIQGILNQNKIWATDYNYINDEEEFIYVLHVLVEIIMEEFGIPCRDEHNTPFCSTLVELLYNQNYMDYYVVSFSSKPDNLTLWAELASPGCNIGFKASEIFNEKFLHFSKVIYEREEQKEVVREALQMAMLHFRPDLQEISEDTPLATYLEGMDANQQAIMAKAAAELLMYYGIGIRSELFSAEEEYRAVFALENHEKKKRMRNDTCVPYIEVPVKCGMKDTAIEVVTLAPSSKDDLTSQSMNDLLCSKGYDDVLLLTSELNLRF